MIVYLVQVSCFWILFYVVYHFALERETFFKANRFYLLLSLLMGLVLPILSSKLPGNPTSETVHSVISQAEVLVLASPLAVSDSTVGFRYSVFTIIYLLGVLFFLFRFLVGLRLLLDFYKGAERKDFGDFTLVLTRGDHMPFSFFRYVFVASEDMERSSLDIILEHERVHIAQWHSLDILFLEILRILFWFNPVLLFYKKSLVVLHEYLADEVAMPLVGRVVYSRLLLRYRSFCLPPELSNSFFQPQIKKRIMKMYQKKSEKKAFLKYLIALPALLLALFLFSCSENSNSTISEEPVLEKDESYVSSNANEPDGKVYKDVDQMPLFPGCEDLSGDHSAKKSCADKKMLHYIYGNIKYPKSAIEDNLQGLVVVGFIVRPDGTIDEPEVLKSPGAVLGDEALRVVRSFNDMPERWEPGYHNGEAVSVQYNLPIRFKLEKQE